MTSWAARHPYLRAGLRGTLLAVAMLTLATAVLLYFAGIAVLEWANLLARAPESEFRLRLRLNPNAAPVESDLDGLDPADRRWMLRMVRSYREAMGR
jgi:hypothetical protein